MIGLQPNIVRLQVAMDNPTFMGCVESQRDLIYDVEDFMRRGTWILPQELREVLAIQEFHHEIGELPTLHDGASKIRDIYHVGVAQTAGCFGFSLESKEKFVVSGE